MKARTEYLQKQLEKEEKALAKARDGIERQDIKARIHLLREWIVERLKTERIIGATSDHTRSY